MRRAPLLRAIALAGLAACETAFPPASRVDGVRVLAARADHPYARPGEEVRVEVLATDGRPRPLRPLRLAWIAAPCVDPPGDAYYGCFAALAARAASGAPLDPLLVDGPALTFTVPPDALASGRPYANAFVFAAACAGHLAWAARRSSSVATVPVACLDDAGAELGSDDFVFAFARVFVFADRTNANPIVDALVLDGRRVDPAAGIELVAGDRARIDVDVPPASQELAMGDVDPDGQPRREGLWVAWFVTAGEVEDDVRVVYDARTGRGRSSVELVAPAGPGDARLWAVVHDDRGGVGWITAPLRIRPAP